MTGACFRANLLLCSVGRHSQPTAPASVQSRGVCLCLKAKGDSMGWHELGILIKPMSLDLTFQFYAYKRGVYDLLYELT